MEYVVLGRANLLISRIALGAYGLQYVESDEAAVELVTMAYQGGINFFDAARHKPLSETRLGKAVQSIQRQHIILATKSTATDGAALQADIEASLDAMHCDYIDLYQIENDTFVPTEKSPDGLYKILKKYQEKGKIKHIGFVTESPELAQNAVDCDLYETIQLPLNILSPELNIEIAKTCEQRDIGFIAMQPLCGGVFRNIPLAYGFLRQYENVIPLWGTRLPEELQQILYFESHPPVIDEKFQEEAQHTRMLFS